MRLLGRLLTPVVLLTVIAANATAATPTWTEIVLQRTTGVASVPGLTRPLLAPSPLPQGQKAAAVPTRAGCLRTWNRSLPQATRTWMRSHAKGAPALPTIWRSGGQRIGPKTPMATIAQCAYAIALGTRDLVLITAPASWNQNGEWSGERERLPNATDGERISQGFPARVTTEGSLAIQP